jgi:alpha-D-ribose 1-methylphosphonate 5-triphosphate synthase subunit PhnH
MSPWTLSTEIAGALFDAQMVVMPRLSAIARCDREGCLEAQTMVVEKLWTACEAGLLIAAGGTAEHVVGLYRGVVRANIDRLTFSAGPPA